MILTFSIYRCIVGVCIFYDTIYRVSREIQRNRILEQDFIHMLDKDISPIEN